MLANRAASPFRLDAVGRNLALIACLMVVSMACGQMKPPTHKNQRNLVPYSGIKSSLRRYRYPIYTKRVMELIDDSGEDCDRVDFRKRFLGGSRMRPLSMGRNSMKRANSFETEQEDRFRDGNGYDAGDEIPSDLSQQSLGIEDLTRHRQKDHSEAGYSVHDWHMALGGAYPESGSEFESKPVYSDQIYSTKRSSDDPYLLWQAAHMAEVGKRDEVTDIGEQNQHSQWPSTGDPSGYYEKRLPQRFSNVFGWDRKKKDEGSDPMVQQYLNTLEQAVNGGGIQAKRQLEEKKKEDKEEK